MTPNGPTRDQLRDARERADARAAKVRNNVKQLREERLLSKAELARQAGVSALTVDRIESGMPCRMDTKRKIILALGMTVAEKDKVFAPGSDDKDQESTRGSEAGNTQNIPWPKAEE